ncbi:hypothetical protein ANCDUO_01586 [Ancylostoma duodenale]|uniref:Uncharacterized protein n=1 Tax=Ancylostoma duodenale TaxID=51022 RepID=A0A0C2HEW5_9BILA|nr:hypothetical protein ANCDUO_01586 [Ancylostoma duodenale]
MHEGTAYGRGIIKIQEEYLFHDHRCIKLKKRTSAPPICPQHDIVHTNLPAPPGRRTIMKTRIPRTDGVKTSAEGW